MLSAAPSTEPLCLNHKDEFYLLLGPDPDTPLSQTISGPCLPTQKWSLPTQLRSPFIGAQDILQSIDKDRLKSPLNSWKCMVLDFFCFAFFPHALCGWFQAPVT